MHLGHSGDLSGHACRLHEYRETVKERAKAVEAEEEKQRLRGQVLGKKVDGPDVNAFLRQLGPDSKAVRDQALPSCKIFFFIPQECNSSTSHGYVVPVEGASASLLKQPRNIAICGKTRLKSCRGSNQRRRNDDGLETRVMLTCGTHLLSIAWFLVQA